MPDGGWKAKGEWGLGEAMGGGREGKAGRCRRREVRPDGSDVRKEWAVRSRERR